MPPPRAIPNPIPTTPKPDLPVKNGDPGLKTGYFFTLLRQPPFLALDWINPRARKGADLPLAFHPRSLSVSRRGFPVFASPEKHLSGGMEIQFGGAEGGGGGLYLYLASS